MFICDISIFNRYGKQKLDEMLHPLGLDWRELVAVLVIEQVPGILQSRLISFLQTDKANVTKLLTSMEGKKLLIRTTTQNDRRNKSCFLTDNAKILASSLHEILLSWENTCFRGLSDAERAEFSRISQKMIVNLTSES